MLKQEQTNRRTATFGTHLFKNYFPIQCFQIPPEHCCNKVPMHRRFATSKLQIKLCVQHSWNDTDRGNRSVWWGSCHSVTLFDTNLTWTDLRPNRGLRGGRPATNCLSHDTSAHFPTESSKTLSFSPHRAVNTPSRL